jgi:RNA polymerase sigma-70 factor, ECF subfamily
MLERTDGEVVAEVLAGGRDAFALLVERHEERCFRFAMGMVRDRDVAADMVQDAFVRAYTHLARCGDGDRFGFWVLTILRNRCTDWLREHRRRDVPLEPGDPYPDPRGGPAEEAERAAFAVRLRGALATLPDAQREAFLLKHVEELSYEEMAGILGARVGALKMRVARAREGLRAALGDASVPEPAGDRSAPRPSLR